jgi:2-keto-4-pentenoate hydratase/2-oxohepta-3-ene-1,7-dioic acid hydratase in catechol pathway
MKLVRFGERGRERPGVWLEHALGPDRHGMLDARGMAFDIEDFTPHFFTHWGVERLRGLLAEARPRIVPAESQRLGPPVPRPGKIICLGKNYADHARELGGSPPASPVLFSKAVTSLNGPHDPIVIARGAERIDAEAELAVVIGAGGRAIAEADALQHVAGYTVFNDVTDRDAQREGQQWFRGKSADTFCPLGPWVVTPDEVPDPQALRLYSRLNGKPLQEGHTRDMMFTVRQLIAFISRAITLEPGDVIATGTPAGIGFARTPPMLLQPGDVIEVGIDGLGELRNPVVAAS